MSSLQEHGGQSRPVNTYWVGPLWTEAAFLGKEDESHRQPLPPGGEDLILVVALE